VPAGGAGSGVGQRRSSASGPDVKPSGAGAGQQTLLGFLRVGKGADSACEEGGVAGQHTQPCSRHGLTGPRGHPKAGRKALCAPPAMLAAGVSGAALTAAGDRQPGRLGGGDGTVAEGRGRENSHLPALSTPAWGDRLDGVVQSCPGPTGLVCRPMAHAGAPAAMSSDTMVESADLHQVRSSGRLVPTSEAAAAWARISQRMQPPKCKGHGEPCVIRTVVDKKKASYGRQFYVRGIVGWARVQEHGCG